jgi:hypothetical protein
MIRIYDGFLEGTLHNRILVGLSGLAHYGAYKNDDIHKTVLMPFYPKHWFTVWKESRHHLKDKPKLDLDLQKYVIHNLSQQSEMLEYCVKRNEWASKKLFIRWQRVSNYCNINASGMF